MNSMKNKALTGAVLALAMGGLYHLEGVRTEAYKDIAGVPTICAGATDGVQLGDKATKEECYTMTLADYQRFEKGVLKYIDLPLRVNEQVALTYFCYNVGESACRMSTAFRLFNQGRTTEGCQAMALFVKATINGKKVVSKGLVNRRAAEVNLCVTPSLLYSYSPVSPV